ncbi:MAG: hypothetical protein OEX98_09215 [Nitrosopumilus sp.]|nr:hypothetical protein [Nitrosopumilus sp.]
MRLDDGTKQHLEKLLDNALELFDGLCARWNDLQPKRQFGINISEDFHLGFVFGKIEDDFVGWFYSKYGRSLTDEEYKQFWNMCKKQVRKLHEKYDVFYFQE